MLRYHSEANLEALAGMNVDALIADNAMSARDPRFADQDQHKTKPDALWDKSAPENQRFAAHSPA